MSGRLHAKARPARTPASSARPKGRATAPSRARRSSPATARPTATRRPTGAATRRSAPSGSSGARARATSARRAATGATAAAVAALPNRRAGAGGGAPKLTPAERAAAETRRNRVRLGIAALAAFVILATSFPLTVLYGQHRQLSAAAAQLSRLTHANALLAEQQQQLNSNAEVERLAQQNYQLVQPGRSLFVILPPAGTAVTAPGSPTTGDPADQPLVSPAQAPNMAPDPGLPQTPTVASGTSSPAATTPPTATRPAGGFWSRIAGSLEFWK